MDGLLTGGAGAVVVEDDIVVAAVVVCAKVNSLLGSTLEKVDRGRWWSRFQKPAGLDAESGSFSSQWDPVIALCVSLSCLLGEICLLDRPMVWRLA